MEDKNRGAMILCNFLLEHGSEKAAAAAPIIQLLSITR